MLKADANFQKKQIIVEYDEKKAELKEVKTAIREAGYEPL
ncbi:COP associated protein [Methanosarcina siciliae]